ncbi:hypothetical protein KTD31_02195 [Burkholderia multivorans]|jgi:hypothetical protein|uniref:hypothetical protein n=1 Tax=Burkholderia multivorans TaxID=87883 RepID=UPI001C21AA1B|nr:hypothetical protein [Burkholderia multivorans]MBU9200216.1 hypothetical protein [Burkholderia multivorans]
MSTQSAIEGTAPAVRAQRASFKPYPQLSAPPALRGNITLHVGLGTSSHKGRIRLPVRLMRSWGCDVSRGVHISTFEGRAYVQFGPAGGPRRQNAGTGEFFLSTYKLNPAVAAGDCVLVQSRGLLCITTLEDAKALAPQAKVVEHQPWRRLTGDCIDTVPQPFGPVNLVEVREIGDVRVHSSRKDVRSRVASVAGKVWLSAGFRVGDSIKVTRYQDATLIEKTDARAGDEGTYQLQGVGGRRHIPRQFIGPGLFDVYATDVVRVISLDGKLLLVQPDSPNGRASAQYLEALALARTPTVTPYSYDNEPILSWKPGKVAKKGYWARGHIWTLGGLPLGTQVSVTRYTDAIECSAAPAGEGALLQPAQANRARYVPQMHLTSPHFNEGDEVFFIAMQSKVLVVRATPEWVERLKSAPAFPEAQYPQYVFMLEHGITLPRAVKPPREKREKWEKREAKRGKTSGVKADAASRRELKHRTTYPMPTGSRLQMQGKWLRECGFLPGKRYRVTMTSGLVRVTLDEAGTVQATKYSATASKLYVPAKLLKVFHTPYIAVDARDGELTLWPSRHGN